MLGQFVEEVDVCSQRKFEVHGKTADIRKRLPESNPYVVKKPGMLEVLHEDTALKLACFVPFG